MEAVPLDLQVLDRVSRKLESNLTILSEAVELVSSIRKGISDDHASALEWDTGLGGVLRAHLACNGDATKLVSIASQYCKAGDVDKLSLYFGHGSAHPLAYNAEADRILTGVEAQIHIVGGMLGVTPDQVRLLGEPRRVLALYRNVAAAARAVVGEESVSNGKKEVS